MAAWGGNTNGKKIRKNFIHENDQNETAREFFRLQRLCKNSRNNYPLLHERSHRYDLSHHLASTLTENNRSQMGQLQSRSHKDNTSDSAGCLLIPLELDSFCLCLGSRPKDREFYSNGSGFLLQVQNKWLAVIDSWPKDGCFLIPHLLVEKYRILKSSQCWSLNERDYTFSLPTSNS